MGEDTNKEIRVTKLTRACSVGLKQHDRRTLDDLFKECERRRHLSDIITYVANDRTNKDLTEAVAAESSTSHDNRGRVLDRVTIVSAGHC